MIKGGKTIDELRAENPNFDRDLEVSFHLHEQGARIEKTKNADELIERYLSLKDHLATQQKAFADFCKPHRDEMEAIEAKLREMLLALGESAESIKTANGTAYTSLITTPGIENRETFIDWAMENWEAGGNEMLQLGKPQVTAVKTWMEEHEGALPPGVKISQFTQLNIRRS